MQPQNLNTAAFPFPREPSSGGEAQHGHNFFLPKWKNTKSTKGKCFWSPPPWHQLLHCSLGRESLVGGQQQVHGAHHVDGEHRHLLCGRPPGWVEVDDGAVAVGRLAVAWRQPSPRWAERTARGRTGTAGSDREFDRRLASMIPKHNFRGRREWA